MISVAIVASGTRGDVQPYIALGKGLQAAGYHVRLLSSDNFAAPVTEAGLAFGAIGRGAEERLQSEEWRRTIEAGNFLAILARMKAEMKQGAAETARRLPPLLEGSDLIITGMAGLAGVYAIAGAFEIPVIQAFAVPFTPTRAFPSPLTPRLPLGALLNRASFHVMRQMFWQMSRAGDAATRQVLGLPKGSFWGPFRVLVRRKMPVLYGYSTHVLPHPHDWPDNHFVTGYWFLDEPDDWQPPADLVEFLAAGDPPVYVGFGSMVSRDPAAAGQIALDALARAGRRGLLASGWGGLQPSALPPTVHMIASQPHSWLFPRMAAVVHHGGAGTTAAGLRAGVPSVVVPFSADQPFWGQRVVELGVGPQPIPHKHLTSERLANAIRAATSDPAIGQRARALGEKIRTEDGVGNAVAVVARFVQRSRAEHLLAR
jgi:sterol 3beta-glucosyltransferase